MLSDTGGPLKSRPGVTHSRWRGSNRTIASPRPSDAMVFPLKMPFTSVYDKHLNEWPPVTLGKHSNPFSARSLPRNPTRCFTRLPLSIPHLSTVSSLSSTPLVPWTSALLVFPPRCFWHLEPSSPPQPLPASHSFWICPCAPQHAVCVWTGAVLYMNNVLNFSGWQSLVLCSKLWSLSFTLFKQP